jgi:hypothetical protein
MSVAIGNYRHVGYSPFATECVAAHHLETGQSPLSLCSLPL